MIEKLPKVVNSDISMLPSWSAASSASRFVGVASRP